MATKRRAETAQENREKMIQAARKAFAEKAMPQRQWMNSRQAWG